MLALFMLGVRPQVILAWLVREMLAVFYSNEASRVVIPGLTGFYLRRGRRSYAWIRRVYTCW